MKRIAIAGAGPGGLAAAVLLASSGNQVTLFEARKEIGGRNGRILLGEYSFDIGPTFFLMPYLLENIFERAGRDLKDYITLSRLDPMYRLVFPDGTVFDPSDSFEKMRDGLRQFSPSDADEFPRYYKYMNKKLSAILPVLSKPYLKASDLASIDLVKAFPYLRPERTLSEELSSFFKDERTQLSFGFQAKYLGMSPYKCPSLFSILNFIEQKYGIWHPTGGLNAITTALARLATELGVQIHLSSPVERFGS
jgi:phytoene desaturase